MTTYSLHLKAKNELTPHPTAQYWRKCQVEELFDLPFMDALKIVNIARNLPVTIQALKSKPC